MKTHRHQSGFTLIEFLVVAVLIGLIATLGGSAFAASLRKGRNAKRIEDMKNVQKAFELYYVTHDSTYSTTCTDMNNDLPGGILPKDPAYYTINCTPTANYSYCACTQIEGSENYSRFGNSGADCSFSGNTHYCVKNVQ